MKALNRQEDEFALSLTPLIDLVFLLIIFFLVSATFARHERSIDINLPSADEASKAPAEEQTLVVNVRESGIIVVKGHVIPGYDVLVETLERAHDLNPNVIVVIRGDRLARHKDVVRVMNAALAAGIEGMSIAVFETKAK